MQHFRTAYTTTCPPDLDGTLPGVCSPTSLARQAEPSIAVEASATVKDGLSDFTDIPIEELALNIFIDRIPLEVELFYDKEDVAVLRTLLEQSDLVQYHRTIATLIGILSDGSDEDILALVDYADRDSADGSAAMMALGYISHLTASDLALSILADRFQTGTGRSAQDAGLGLVLAGNPVGFELLREGASRASSAEVQNDLLRGATESERIFRLGLHEHYRNPPVIVPSDPDTIPKGPVEVDTTN